MKVRYLSTVVAALLTVVGILDYAALEAAVVISVGLSVIAYFLLEVS